MEISLKSLFCPSGGDQRVDTLWQTAVLRSKLMDSTSRIFQILFRAKPMRIHRESCGAPHLSGRGCYTFRKVTTTATRLKKPKCSKHQRRWRPGRSWGQVGWGIIEVLGGIREISLLSIPEFLSEPRKMVRANCFRLWKRKLCWASTTGLAHSSITDGAARFLSADLIYPKSLEWWSFLVCSR